MIIFITCVEKFRKNTFHHLESLWCKMPTDLTSWNSRLCQETTPRPYTKLLIFLFQRKMCDNNIREVISAANFAAIKHKNQKRSDPEGTPYINHPLGVAHILSQVWRWWWSINFASDHRITKNTNRILFSHEC